MGKKRGKAKAYAKNPATASEWEQNLWNCFLHFWSNMLILYMGIKVLSKNKLVDFAKSLEIIASSILLILGRNSVSKRKTDTVPGTLTPRPVRKGYKTI